SGDTGGVSTSLRPTDPPIDPLCAAGGSASPDSSPQKTGAKTAAIASPRFDLQGAVRIQVVLAIDGEHLRGLAPNKEPMALHGLMVRRAEQDPVPRVVPHVPIVSTDDVVDFAALRFQFQRLDDLASAVPTATLVASPHGL